MLQIQDEEEAGEVISIIIMQHLCRGQSTDELTEALAIWINEHPEAWEVYNDLKDPVILMDKYSKYERQFNLLNKLSTKKGWFVFKIGRFCQLRADRPAS